jgi:predicted phosphodiesterase
LWEASDPREVCCAIWSSDVTVRTAVAVFSDIHGNLAALDAILADAAVVGVDEFWVVGDLVAHGPPPAETLERLRNLPGLQAVRGNTDRYVLTGDLPPMIASRDTVETPEDARLLADASASFAWTRGAVTATGGYEWLASLPVELRLRLPDATRVLLVHASPGRDDGMGLQRGMSEEDLRRDGWDEAEADLILVGHTHVPLDRTLGDVRLVNLGSVSIPATEDPRAMWTLLSADSRGYRLEHRFAAYDPALVRDHLDLAHHPSAEWLKRKFPVGTA